MLSKEVVTLQAQEINGTGIWEIGKQQEVGGRGDEFFLTYISHPRHLNNHRQYKFVRSGMERGLVKP